MGGKGVGTTFLINKNMAKFNIVSTNTILPEFVTNKLHGCSSMIRAFTHGVMGRRINPSCGEPIELFPVPASAPTYFQKLIQKV